MITLTQERLRELLDYDPETGVFTWKVNIGKGYIGCVAGCLNTGGYLTIGVDLREYRAHRLAWLWMTGDFPVNAVDHRDGVRTNNRWRNLRPAIKEENCQNLKLLITNKSGYTGVSWCASRGKWDARITSFKKLHLLGRFDRKEDARDAYLEAKSRLHHFQPTPRDA